MDISFHFKVNCNVLTNTSKFYFSKIQMFNSVGVSLALASSNYFLSQKLILNKQIISTRRKKSFFYSFLMQYWMQRKHLWIRLFFSIELRNFYLYSVIQIDRQKNEYILFAAISICNILCLFNKISYHESSKNLKIS